MDVRRLRTAKRRKEEKLAEKNQVRLESIQSKVQPKYYVLECFLCGFNLNVVCPKNKGNLWPYLAPKSHKRKLLQTSWLHVLRIVNVIVLN